MTRKEAKEYIIKHCNPHRDTGTQWDDAMECAIKALEEPEPKKGKWIVDNVETEHCSVCKHRFYISALFAVGGNDEPPCCPNCGARMEEDE